MLAKWGSFPLQRSLDIPCLVDQDMPKRFKFILLNSYAWQLLGSRNSCPRTCMGTHLDTKASSFYQELEDWDSHWSLVHLGSVTTPQCHHIKWRRFGVLRYIPNNKEGQIMESEIMNQLIIGCTYGGSTLPKKKVIWTQSKLINKTLLMPTSETWP